MDMKVDSKLIRAEREKRAWSQEHLAEVTGLGLRTVQRIEATGAASFESVRALAAVLEIDAARLRIAGDVAPQGRASRPFAWRLRTALGAAAAAIAIGGGLLVASTGFAEQIMLDVGISMTDAQNDVRAWKTRALVDEGTLVRDVNDLTIFEKLKVQVVPTVTDDGHIFIAAKVYVFAGAGYELVSSPSLITENGQQAGIKVTTSDGTLLEFEIKPQRVSLL
jgi:transcriptional regulator with XRE-family HTH domain